MNQTSNSSKLFFFSTLSLTFLLTFLAYYPAHRSDFIIDDFAWLKPTSFQELLGFFTKSWGIASAYRPISRVSLWLDLTIFGENPLFWHLHNYVIHALNATLLAVIIRHFSKNTVLAMIGASLFAVGAVLHENIVWISGRTHSLALLFTLLSLISYHLHLEKPSWKSYASSLICMALAMGIYESAYILPGLLTLLFIANKNFSKHEACKLIGFYVLFGAIVVVRYFALEDVIGHIGENTKKGIIPNLLLMFPTAFHFMLGEWYSKFSIIGLAGLSLLYMGVYHKQYQFHDWLPIILGAIFCIACYAPFAMAEAPAFGSRFIYSSYFFLLFTLMYLLAQVMKHLPRKAYLLPLAALMLPFYYSVSQSRVFAEAYSETGHAFRVIPEQIKAAYPIWPKDTYFILVKLPHTNKGTSSMAVLVNEAIFKKYDKVDGKVKDLQYAEKKPAVMEDIRQHAKIVFEFVGFSEGVRELSEAEAKQQYPQLF